jgi:alpha-ketoglutarate-dependent taurine dioxygenase
MWDNRCLTHGRTWFSPQENRLLRRCTVEGTPLSD